MKTSKPLLTLRMLFPAAASFIVLLLGEWIARGSLTADTFISFIFPHFGAYLLAWLLLFLVWELLDWVLRIPPLATLGMAVLGCAPCAVNFYTMQLRGEPFLPWDLMQVSEAAGVAEAVQNIFRVFCGVHDGEAAETLVEIEARFVSGARIHAVADAVFGEFNRCGKFFSGERTA